jgi:hypothetical protein
MIKSPALRGPAISLLMCVALPVAAQLDCRSILGAWIKPFSENSRFSWGTELTIAPGLMRDRTIFNSLVMGGFEYSSKNLYHTVYLEGVGKYWYNSVTGQGTGGTTDGYADFSKPAENHLGIRELFYRYNGRFMIKGGIQSVKSPDFFLIDERMLGISAQKTTGAVHYDLQSGTVFSGIARMRDVCGVRHLYNLTRGGKISFVGDNPGDANFFLGSVTWVPDRKSIKDGSVSQDEFTSTEEKDEFSATGSEFSDMTVTKEKKGLFTIEKTGFLFYEEFGSRFHDYKYHGAVFAEINMPWQTRLRGELLYQYARNTKAFVLMTSLDKDHQWENGATTGFGGKLLILMKQDTKVLYFPAFSNLFLGEMLRLDAMHMPLFTLSADHTFATPNKLHFKIDYVQQLKGDHSKEFDCIAGIKLGHHAKLSAVTGYVNSDLLTESNFLGRLELRIAF